VIWAWKKVLWRRVVIKQTRVVVQGVYGHVEDEDTGEWPSGSKPRTRIVFIGQLPPALQDDIRRGLIGCLAPGYLPTSDWALDVMRRQREMQEASQG
jgi:hypothetical protein